MRTISTLLFFVLFLFSFTASAQVNAYARVSSVASGATRLNLSSVNESFDTFEDGDQVIVIQMQDDVIGSTGNNSSFGSLGDIEMAGRYEIATIQSHNESAGVPTYLILTGALQNSYSTGTHASLQVISFPRLGSPNYTTTANIPALAWDGQVGGIVAFQVAGTLTLAHSIHANGRGFRGGTANGGGSDDCMPNSNYRVSEREETANKGEGLYKVTQSNYAAGRARIVSGGGGGNSHNGGGGGGSHFTAGGEGGPGWGCSPSSGGLGGEDLGIYTLPGRMFMGGGGGAGEGNDGYNTAGGNGAGIVFIVAAAIQTTGTAAGLSIQANGVNPQHVGNDGAGGAGAGGTVYIICNNWNIVATAPLRIQANGGNGGNVQTADQHGGGGGGGQGVVMLTSNTPNNTQLETIPGNGGLNFEDGTAAQSGSGTSGVGVKIQVNAILPTQVVYFTGRNNGNRNSLHWIAGGETPQTIYSIERSLNGGAFAEVATLFAKTNGNGSYSWEEPAIGELSTYRIKIVEPGILPSFTQTIVLRTTTAAASVVEIQPNPARQFSVILFQGKQPGTAQVSLTDLSGRPVRTWQEKVLKGANTWMVSDLGTFTAGIYLVRIVADHQTYTAKLVVVK